MYYNPPVESKSEPLTQRYYCFKRINLSQVKHKSRECQHLGSQVKANTSKTTK